MATEGAATLRRVVSDIDIAYDGGVQHVSAGTIVWVEPGSVLEAYYGPGNLETVDDPAALAAHAGVSN